MTVYYCNACKTGMNESAQFCPGCRVRITQKTLVPAQKSSTVRGFSVLLVLGGAVVAAYILLSGVFGSSGSSGSPHESVSVSGGLPGSQSVGFPVQSNLTVKNTGSDISHLVLDLTGITDHWVLNNVTSDVGQGTQSAAGEYVDFGDLGPGQSLSFTLDLNPKDAGNHDANICVANGWDASSEVPTDILDCVQKTVAINP